MKKIIYAVLCALCCACSSDDDEIAEVLPPVSDEEEIVEDTTSTESVAELDSMEFCCTRDSLNIYGLLYKKVAAGRKVPAVILSHSNSLTHSAMKDYARAIADKGMVAYCFDFCGGSTESRSDGSTDDMTVFSEVDDLHAVLTAIRRLDYVNTDSVYLLGSSQGGLVSALVAEQRASDLCGMLLFYPAFNLPEMVKMFSDMMNQWGGSLGGGSWGGGSWGNSSWGSGFGGFGTMSETYVNAIKDYDVWSHIGTFPHPITIVHGSADIIVPVSYSEKAVSIYQQANPDVQLHVIEGANHGFNSANLGSMGSLMGATADYDDQVMPVVYQFLHR